MKLAPERPIVPADYLQGGKSSEIAAAIALIPKLNSYIDYLEAQKDETRRRMMIIMKLPQMENTLVDGRNFFDIMEDVINGI